MHSIFIDSAAAIPGTDAPAPRNWRRIALGGFLVVSALGHGLLLLLPMQEPPRPQAGADRGALQVRMQTSAPTTAVAAAPETEQQPTQSDSGPKLQAEPAVTPTRKSAPQAEPEQKPAKPLPSESTTTARAPSKPAPESEPAPNAGPVPAAAPPAGGRATEARTAQQAAPDAADAAASTAGSEFAAAQRLRTQLQASLRSHFYYPRIARHRGWEGLVEVGLRIEANGRLSDIRILRTSGFAILDRAALASVGRISRLQGAAEWLGGHHIDMVLPVQYRLIDG